MSTIKVCDRCGAKIDTQYPYRKLFRRPMITMRLIDRFICGDGKYDYLDTEFELCDECTRSFGQWHQMQSALKERETKGG